MGNDIVASRVNALQGELEKALPAQVPSEKFQRILITTIKTSPDLMEVFKTEIGQRSIFASALKAAQDGLIPDGREAALVVFNNKQKNGSFTKEAQYMPMVWGLLRKARNSDEIASFNEPQIVYKKDIFIYEAGDNERLEHQPDIFAPDRGDPVGAYAIAKLKNGETVRAVMSKSAILKRKDASKAGKSSYGPWAKWEEEMWKKTVMKQLIKYLPSSVDVNAAFAKDDTMQPAENHRGPDNAKDITPEPTRNQFAEGLQEQSAADADIVFELTGPDGEVETYGSADLYVTAFINLLQAARTLDALQGVWESNQGHMADLGTELRDGLQDALSGLQEQFQKQAKPKPEQSQDDWEVELGADTFETADWRDYSNRLLAKARVAAEAGASMEQVINANLMILNGCKTHAETVYGDIEYGLKQIAWKA